ncbi:MAG TPA: metalloregulator ArsR/SmtB family transcription factor [Anaeromyxobacteraceae bacterium]|nr:metalloregulator ArsR/SmtB family transcription factor [Anaeromyxobacteraceae bacterium]
MTRTRGIRNDAHRAAHCAEILKAVAHPLRLRIVAILEGGEAHVTTLAKHLGAPQAIVSQQLRILRSHGLVGATRMNGFATYRLLEPSLRELVGCLERCQR